MNLIANIVVGSFGLWLAGSGLYHHLNFRRLRGDPLLIGACYLLSAGCLTALVV